MTNNTIRSLVFKLLSSDNLLERIAVSNAIFSIVRPAGDFGGIEQTIRNHFFCWIKVCTLNPLSRQRAALEKIAEFYEVNYLEVLKPTPRRTKSGAYN